MATTSNSRILPQTPASSAHVLATGDQTTPALLFAAGSNGTRLYKIDVYPGAAANREVGIYVYDGSNSRALCLVDVTADGAATILPVNVLADVPMDIDENGNKYMDLQSGYSIYISGENVAETNGIYVSKWNF